MLTGSVVQNQPRAQSWEVLSYTKSSKTNVIFELGARCLVEDKNVKGTEKKYIGYNLFFSRLAFIANWKWISLGPAVCLVKCTHVITTGHGFSRLFLMAVLICTCPLLELLFWNSDLSKAASSMKGKGEHNLYEVALHFLYFNSNAFIGCVARA